MRGVSGAVCLVLLAWDVGGCGPGTSFGRREPAAVVVEPESVASAAEAEPRHYRLEPSRSDDGASRSRFVAWSSDAATAFDAPLPAADLAAAGGSTDAGAGYAAANPFDAYSTALGSDPVDARGHLMGSDIGDAYSTGGFGLVGAGAGSGGANAAGFGLGAVGEPGHGYGTAAGPELSGRSGRTPDLRLGDATTYGGLSREVIRRVVRQHQARFRVCYEAALASAPEAAGRVNVRFTIGPDGTVVRASVASTSTGDEALARCIESVVLGMSFPASDGMVEVSYPFLFQPDDAELVVVARDGGGADAPSGPPVLPPPPPPPPPLPTQGALRAKNGAGEWVGEFPLEHTEVAAQISGYVACTEVAQRYGNPYDEPIEAVYVFPLPALGAVHDFVMEVGGRTIVGVVRERAEAERIYAEARAQGRTASLLSEERPNVFTQSVANIEPGGEVTIRLTFFERLTAERGAYEWVFPMVVGPR
ncbi:MAG: TonB family protein, partial [Deltaproteobacteria bacterium]|nr:TonB family protein [Deltaproteobacteria bacterium]